MSKGPPWGKLSQRSSGAFPHRLARTESRCISGWRPPHFHCEYHKCVANSDSILRVQEPRNPPTWRVSPLAWEPPETLNISHLMIAAALADRTVMDRVHLPDIWRREPPPTALASLHLGRFCNIKIKKKKKTFEVVACWRWMGLDTGKMQQKHFWFF
jgi:hypothetical protein